MSIFKRLHISVGHAWDGLLLAFRQEFSFRIQVVAALAAGIFIFLFPLSRAERSLIVLAIGSVLVLELLNSTIERFVDMVKPRVYEYARHVKDLSAAAVLVMTVTAVILAAIIFGPYLTSLARL